LNSSVASETPPHHPLSPPSIKTTIKRWRRSRSLKKYPLLALLPVYNREDLLTQCLEALRPAVDGIIVLDDGSTDETPHILRQEPKIIEILTKPPKSLSEWNDAANRFLLYEAAHAYRPEWLLCVDSDEILEPTFLVYKEYLMDQSSRISGYAFPLVAIYQNKITGPLFVDRMYRFRPGYRFDSRRLHCRIFPLDITDEMVRAVNIRLFHYSASPEQKLERYNKYLIADAQREFQASYENLLRTNPSSPILPIGGELELRPFSDSVIEVKRFFPDIEPASETTRMHLLFLQTRLGELVDLMKDFHNSTLDFFYIESRLLNGNFLLSYLYDSAKALEVSAPCAWLIEKYRMKKDFFYLAAGLATFLGLEPSDGIAVFGSALAELKQLKILL
jgi:glycosyltransferase involved in cell wall biosynthesis